MPLMLATLNDLADIGAVPHNEDPSSLRTQRALGLIAKASAQAMNHLLRVTSQAVVDAFTDEQKTALAAIVAEGAASRMQFDTAPSTDQGAYPTGYVSSLLNRQHYRALDRLLKPQGSISVTTERDATSSWFDVSSSDDLWWTVT